jgi:hypothetical protein
MVKRNINNPAQSASLRNPLSVILLLGLRSRCIFSKVKIDSPQENVIAPKNKI